MSSVISTSVLAEVVSTNLKRDAGKCEDSLGNRIKLRRVNLLLVTKRENRPQQIQCHI